MAQRQASTDAAQGGQDRELLGEKERIGRLSTIREVVFGSLDGLLVPLGVVSGVAGGTSNSHIVLVAGIAEAFAGALSMGAGEFISGRAEAQVQQTEIERKGEALRGQPEREQRDMVRLLQREGVGQEDAERIAALLVRYPRSFQNTIVEKELGLPAETDTVRIPQALVMGLSYIVGSLFPLLPYFFAGAHAALPISIALTALALVIVGIVKGRLASLNLVGSVIEVVVVGGASAAGGFVLGSWLPHVLGY